jgi:hypothetical protein
MSFELYSDSGLTTLAPLNLLQTAGVAPAAVTGLMYLGSTDSGLTLQANSDPGVDPLVLQTVDANALTGAAATAVKLALSSGGLTSATGGAPLNLPHTILGGVANALPIHYKFEPQTLDAGLYTDLSFLISAAIEF